MFGGPWHQHGKRRVLRPFTLRVLYEAPRNGAEIMDEIERTTRGRWRPSPGSVYPLLEDLTNEKLVRKRADGRYELTDAARRDFQWPWAEQGEARGAESVLRELEGYASYFEEISQAAGPEWSALKPRLRALAKRLAKLTEE